MSTNLMDRLAQANPKPQGSDLPDDILSAQALRTVIDTRRANVDTKQTEQIAEFDNEPKQRRPALVAAAVAFVIVAVVGLGIGYVTNQGTDSGEVVSPSDIIVDAEEELVDESAAVESTTEAQSDAPVVDPIDQAKIAARIEAATLLLESYNDGVEAFGMMMEPIVNDPESYVHQLTWEAAIGSRLDVTYCEAASDALTVRCIYTVSTVLHDALGTTPEETMLVSFGENDVVESIKRWDAPGSIIVHGYSWWASIYDYPLWIRDTYPDDWTDWVRSNTGIAIITPENNVIHARLVQEFLASLDS